MTQYAKKTDNRETGPKVLFVVTWNQLDGLLETAFNIKSKEDVVDFTLVCLTKEETLNTSEIHISF